MNFTKNYTLLLPFTFTLLLNNDVSVLDEYSSNGSVGSTALVSAQPYGALRFTKPISLVNCSETVSFNDQRAFSQLITAKIGEAPRNSRTIAVHNEPHYISSPVQNDIRSIYTTYMFMIQYAKPALLRSVYYLRQCDKVGLFVILSLSRITA